MTSRPSSVRRSPRWRPGACATARGATRCTPGRCSPSSRRSGGGRGSGRCPRRARSGWWCTTAGRAAPSPPATSSTPPPCSACTARFRRWRRSPGWTSPCRRWTRPRPRGSWPSRGRAHRSPWPSRTRSSGRRCTTRSAWPGAALCTPRRPRWSRIRRPCCGIASPRRRSPTPRSRPTWRPSPAARRTARRGPRRPRASSRPPARARPRPIGSDAFSRPSRGCCRTATRRARPSTAARSPVSRRVPSATACSARSPWPPDGPPRPRRSCAGRGPRAPQTPIPS